MKSLRLLLALATVLAGCLAQAAQPATGGVTGRVQNLVAGKFLNNARVSVPGTDLVAFTDQYGTYRLANLPAGPVTLEVFYTGLDSQRTTVTVSAGRMTTQDFDLSSTARFGTGDVIKLDAFTVASARETDNDAIAINEQRFAPNIKTVVAAD